MRSSLFKKFCHFWNIVHPFWILREPDQGITQDPAAMKLYENASPYFPSRKMAKQCLKLCLFIGYAVSSCALTNVVLRIAFFSLLT